VVKLKLKPTVEQLLFMP